MHDSLVRRMIITAMGELFIYARYIRAFSAREFAGNSHFREFRWGEQRRLDRDSDRSIDRARQNRRAAPDRVESDGRVNLGD